MKNSDTVLGTVILFAKNITTILVFMKNNTHCAPDFSAQPEHLIRCSIVTNRLPSDDPPVVARSGDRSRPKERQRPSLQIRRVPASVDVVLTAPVTAAASSSAPMNTPSASTHSDDRSRPSAWPRQCDYRSVTTTSHRRWQQHTASTTSSSSSVDVVSIFPDRHAF
ncbi:hypothetical protein ACLOJK_028754 [Asimina triloba]